MIAHNMAVVRHVCERTQVMYLGRIVESAPTGELFSDPRHPYTRALLNAIPCLIPGRRSPEPALVGDPPSPIHLPPGCRFNPRCPMICGRYGLEPEPGWRTVRPIRCMPRRATSPGRRLRSHKGDRVFGDWVLTSQLWK